MSHPDDWKDGPQLCLHGVRVCYWCWKASEAKTDCWECKRNREVAARQSAEESRLLPGLVHAPVPRKNKKFGIRKEPKSNGLRVFTDVSYVAGAGDRHIGVGLAVQDGSRVFLAGFRLEYCPRRTNPEDVAIQFAKRAFGPDATYYTDFMTTKEGTPTWRNHPMIVLCDKLARMVRKSASLKGWKQEAQSVEPGGRHWSWRERSGA